MNIKKNRGWIVLLVVLLLWEIFTIASIKTQNKKLERQINDRTNDLYDEIHSIHGRFYEIKTDISEELEKQSSFLSDYTADISFKDGILFLDLSFTPKEYKSEDRVEVVFTSAKETKVFTAIENDGAFKVKGELLPSDNFEATVRFISEEAIRQERLPKIEAAEDLAFEYNARLLSEIEFLKESSKDITGAEDYDGADIMVVYISPFDRPGRIDAPYKDIELAKLTLTNRATSKTIKEVNLEESTDDNFYKDNKSVEGSSVFIAKLPDLKGIEGSFRIECEIKTKDGLVYVFDIGTIDNYADVDSKKLEGRYFIDKHHGTAYPEF